MTHPSYSKGSDLLIYFTVYVDTYHHLHIET